VQFSAGDLDDLIEGGFQGHDCSFWLGFGGTG
jgi:hypothetical protein